jgi:hypothetical protein
MKKLTKEDLKEIKGGVGTGGTSLCYFVSSTCGTMCINPNEPTGPFPPAGSCAAYMAYLNPSCHFTYTQVKSCPVE